MRLLWLFYTAFVVYGSLVPLEFSAMPLEEALEAFLRIPYLNIGVTGRQDWVANLVLYIPMAFLGCRALASAKASWIWKAFVAVFVLLLSLGIAIGVEFTQIFFPRTVSLNDLIAEGIGSGLGVAFFLLLHTRLETLWRQIWGRAGRQTLQAGLALYVLFYLLYCLFPYDFLISKQELLLKLYADRSIVWWSPFGEYGWLLSLAKLGAEVGTALPLGIWLWMRRRKTKERFAAAALIALLWGGVLEGSQFFIASGITQGASVVSRACGIWLGFFLAAYHHRLLECMQNASRPSRRRLLYGSFWLYFMALAGINWFGRDGVNGLSQALNQLASLRFIPFYYHYYLSENQALFSLLAYTLMYVPVGCFWGLYAVHFHITERYGLRIVAMSNALLFAGLFEGGKLFFQGTMPDPTNLLIASFAGWVGYRGVLWAARIAEQTSSRALSEQT
jgi:VanZ family protein